MVVRQESEYIDAALESYYRSVNKKTDVYNNQKTIQNLIRLTLAIQQYALHFDRMGPWYVGAYYAKSGLGKFGNTAKNALDSIRDTPVKEEDAMKLAVGVCLEEVTQYHRRILEVIKEIQQERKTETV